MGQCKDTGQCGRQNMLWPYLTIWDWDWIFVRAVKTISFLGVCSLWLDSCHFPIIQPLGHGVGSRLWGTLQIRIRFVRQVCNTTTPSLNKQTNKQNSLIYESKTIIIFGQNSSKLDILRLLLMFILFLAARARAFLALLLCFLSALLYFSAFYQYNGRLTARRGLGRRQPHSCAPARRSRRATPPSPPKPWWGVRLYILSFPSSKVGKSKSSTVRPRK